MADYKTEYDAVYFDGRTPVRNEVKVTVTREGLKLSSIKDSSRDFWFYSDIRQTNDIHADGHVKFEKRGELDNSALIIDDTSVIDAIKNISPDFQGNFQRTFNRSRWIRWLTYSFLAAVVAGFVIYKWLLPSFIDVVAEIVPVSWEESVGDRYRTVYSQPFGQCDDRELNDSVNMIKDRLVKSLGSSPYNYNITILNNEMINAFALPGGYILILDGLIKATDRPEELAGVLAHEIQHVEQRHSTRMVLREASFGLLISAVTGNSQGFDKILQTARQIGALGYSRDSEQSADTEGMKLMIKSGIDPTGMIDFFEIMKKESGDMKGFLEYLSTHPSTGDRIARLEKMVEGKNIKYDKLLKDKKWDEIKAWCMATDKE